MLRLFALLVGLVAGLAGAGIAAGFVLPQLPPAVRSPLLVWTSTAVLIGAGVAVAFVMTRPRRS